MDENHKSTDSLNPADYFPTIRTLQDNLGNKIERNAHGHTMQSSINVREGDTIELAITVNKPEALDIEYAIGFGEKEWSKSHSKKLTFEHKHIGMSTGVIAWIRSTKDYHAYIDMDDYVQIRYTVLPRI